MGTQGLGARGVVVLAAVVAVLTVPAAGRAQQPAMAGRVDEVDTWIAQQREALGIPGLAVGIVVDGEEVLASGHGVTQLDGGQRVTGDTPFVIASVGKGVTALAVGRLVDDGRLGFDDPVSRHLPELAPEGDDVTIADLLHHRSGLDQTRDFSGWSSTVLDEPWTSPTSEPTSRPTRTTSTPT